MPLASLRDIKGEGRKDRLSWRLRRKQKDTLQKVDVSERLQRQPWLAELLTAFMSDPHMSLLRALAVSGHDTPFKRKEAYTVCRSCDWRLSRAVAWAEINRLKSEYFKAARRDVRPLIERAQQRARDAALLMQPDSYGLWLLEQEKEMRAVAESTTDPKGKLEAIKSIESIRSLYVKLFGSETELLGPTAKLETGRKPAPPAATPDAEPLTDEDEQRRLEQIAAAVGQNLPPLVLEPQKHYGPVRRAG